MKKLMRLAVVAVLFVLLAGMASAQKATGDPRVKKALDSLGIKYTVNDKGNFLVTFSMENNDERSQLVRVVSSTETYRGAEVREIWTLAYTAEEYPDDELLYRLMEQNSTGKLGAWAMEADEDGVAIYYTAKVPVYLKNEDLKMFIYFVAEIADELEEEVLGTDEN